MKIFIDFDDTIAMSVENVLRIVNKRYNKNVSVEDIGKWDFSDVYPDIPLKDIVKVFGEEEFFKTLKLKQNVLPVLRKYTKYNDVIIVSKTDMTAMQRKNAWINEHIKSFGISLRFIGIMLKSSKGVLDMSGGIMIDDNATFLNETNAKYKILYKNKRKFDELQEWDGYTVSSWKELNTLLHKIIANEKGYTNGKI